MTKTKLKKNRMLHLALSVL